jgi:hypothetical protein
VKVGDLVRLPKQSRYWWSGKVGLVIGYGYGDRDDDHRNPDYRALHIIIGQHHVRFGENFVELISEGR